MAQEDELNKKPAEKAKPAAEKEAVKAHKGVAAEAPKEHKPATHEPKAHDKEAPKEAKPHEASREAVKESRPAPKAADGAEQPKATTAVKPATKPTAAAGIPKKKAPAPAAGAVAKAPRPKVIGKADIGIDVKPPARACSDQNCPFHGRLPVRGQIFEGTVISDGMDKSAVIRRERLVFVPKYERYMKRTSRMSVHSPPCIAAKAGDQVTVMECRPLSKTIAFTIVSKKGETKAKTE